jgi:hypothetical protein
MQFTCEVRGRRVVVDGAARQPLTRNDCMDVGPEEGTPTRGLMACYAALLIYRYAPKRGKEGIVA